MTILPRFLDEPILLVKTGDGVSCLSNVCTHRGKILIEEPCLHGVELEDEAVVEIVQKGVRSRLYSYGRYSPTREQGTHHFHRLIAEFME
ncbi:MAG: SRPBCC family protein [Pyrinomonadaceae bacterium]